MSDKQAQDLIDRLSKMRPEHDQFDKLLGDCAEFCLPFSEGTLNQPDNTSISARLFDETALLAGEFFDCAMHGMLTNPAGTWFALETEDPDQMENDEVKNFLQHATKRMHHILSNTNFHTAMAQEYTHLRTFGTAPIYAEEDRERGVRFKPAYIGSIYCAENNREIIDTTFREFTFTARQASQQWGEAALPKAIKDALKSQSADRERKFKFIHATFPREDRGTASKKSTDMPFASFYVNIDEQVVIAEGGYFENPWQLRGGRSRGARPMDLLRP